MALYRLEFLISSDVDVTSGTGTVTLNDGQDVSSVVPGTAVFINNQVVEAVSGQNISPTQSTITLRYNWPFATVTSGRLVAFNTFEGLNTAITRLNDVIGSVPDFTGATGQGFLYNNGSDTYSIKPSTIFGESLLNANDASSALSILQSPDYPSFAGQAGILKKDEFDVYSLVTSTAFGESLLSQVDATTARTTLGITDPSAFGESLVTQNDAASARSTLEITDPSTFGQTLITQTDATSARSTLGVVSATDAVEGLIRRATTVEAQEGTDDITAMSPLKSFQQANKLGIGLSAVPIKTITNNSEWAINTGATLFSSGASISAPVSGLAVYSTNIGKRDSLGGYALLSASFDPSLERFFVGQSLDDVEAPKWSELLHENSLLNCQNVSGGSIASNGTVAGSSLNPAKSGTWRNIQTSDVPNNSYGIFKRVF